MSLSEQIQRVDGSQNDILKALAQSYGINTAGLKIDQIAAAVKASQKFKLDGLLSTATASKYGLGAAATPNDAFEKIKVLLDAVQNTAKIVQGSYVGTDELTKTINLGFRPKLLIIRSNNGEEVRTGRGDLLLWMGQPSEYGGKADPEVTTFSVTDTTFTMQVTKGDPSHGDWIYSSRVYNKSSIEYLYAGVG